MAEDWADHWAAWTGSVRRFNTTHVAAGSPTGGQFGSASGGSSAAKTPDAHQKHVAHLQHLSTHGTPAQQRSAKAQLARIAAQQKAAKAKAKAPAKPKTTAKAPKPAAVKPKTTAKPKTAAKPAVKTPAKPAPTPAARKKQVTGEIGTLKAALTASQNRHVTGSAATKAHTEHMAHLQHEIHLLAQEAGKL